MPHASHLADALCYVAAPTFAVLAIANALYEGRGMAVLCSGGSVINGMTMMYLLMSAFHTAPWLKLIARRRSPTAISPQVEKPYLNGQ
jgi:hypothetical protein